MGRILQIICGCVLAVALGAAQSADPVGKQGGRQSSSAESQGRTQEQAESAAAPSVEDSLQSIARNVEAAQTGPNAEKSENRADRDLGAQESMARWAKWMFFAAVLTTIISGAGVFLIWRTLLYTRSAAKSADDIVAVTRDAANTQLRAYVGMSDTEIRRLKTEDGDCLAIEITLIWKNVGATPAVRVIGAGGVYFVSGDGRFPDNHVFGRGESTGEFITLAPSQTLRVTRTIAQQDIAGPHLGEQVYIMSFVEYDDVLTDTPRRRTEVCYAVTTVVGPLENPASSIVLRYCGPLNGVDEWSHEPVGHD